MSTIPQFERTNNFKPETHALVRGWMNHIRHLIVRLPGAFISSMLWNIFNPSCHLALLAHALMAAPQLTTVCCSFALGKALKRSKACCHWPPQALMAALKLKTFGWTSALGISLNNFKASCHKCSLAHEVIARVKLRSSSQSFSSWASTVAKIKELACQQRGCAPWWANILIFCRSSLDTPSDSPHLPNLPGDGLSNGRWREETPPCTNVGCSLGTGLFFEPTMQGVHETWVLTIFLDVLR